MTVFSALLQNGPLQVGALADRGAFDPYARYRPGQVVVDDGVVYLNIAAVGAAPELEDFFDRRDQQGWGQSSHGEVWQTSAGYAGLGPSAIAAGAGVLALGPDHEPTDGQLLGPARLRADAELLARLEALSVPTDTVHLVAALNVTEDASNAAQVTLALNDDGTTALQLQSLTAADGSEVGDPGAGPTLGSGLSLWLRLRRVGLAYTAVAWFVGTPELGTPQATLTATHAQPAGHPALALVDGPEAAGWRVAYLGVRPLTAATVPADDSEHWVALADALQVPQPL